MKIHWFLHGFIEFLMKIGLVHLDDSAYFNLKTMFIVLKTKSLQTRIAKLGHLILAFVQQNNEEIRNSGKGLGCGNVIYLYTPSASFRFRA